VVWLGVQVDTGALAQLAADVQGAVGECGFDLEERAFRPHITLGRPGPRFDAAAWLAVLEAGVPPARFTADRVVLYESRGGHHVREVFRLTGAAVEAGA
jgi:2'-5' RNA ligase